jgi:MFS transporter, DHA2 family, multidrug resistance protein
MMIATYVHDPEHQQKPKGIDYLGIALLTVSVGSLQYVLEHGQREDWFASHLIIGLTLIGLVGSAVLLWRELTTDHPAIDFRVLRHRQMWVGTVLGVVMGIGLYAMAFTLPVFLQGNLRMTAQQTGIILLPGALATAVCMAVVGRLSNKVDPRLLITAGALIFADAAWQLSKITGESGQHDFFWPLILRGLGLGLMFVPLTTITLAELAPTELAQGAGLYNFFRQLGGSFGIAGISTLVTRYTAQNHATLVEHVSGTDPLAMSRLDAMTRGMMARGADFMTARKQAFLLMDRQVMGQASVLAYGKIYVLSAFIILALIPLLLLVRNTKGSGGGHAVME